MPTVIIDKIQLRRGTATQWENANPILAEGEPGFDLTNEKQKIGDGITPWNFLPYQNDDSGGTSDLPVGDASQYYRGDKTLGTFASAVLGVALAGISFASSLDITALDTVLGAFGKAQAQLTSIKSTKADLNSPAFTGNPTVPNQAAGNNSTRAANTAYVDTAIANLINSAPGALDTLNELATALSNDPNFATTVTNNLAAKANLAGGAVFTGQITNSLNGAASTPPLLLNGTWFSGGTATTTKPQLLIEPSGATSTGWSTSGTGLGVNAATGFGGDIVNFQANGTSRFRLDNNGNLSNIVNETIAAGGYYGFSGRSTIKSNSDGNLQLSNSAGTNFSLLQFGGTTSSFPALKRNSAGLDVRLADDSAFATLTGRLVGAPTATLAGLNPGSVAGDPSTPANGDIWYDSTGNLLRARINGATVSLGAGGGGGASSPLALTANSASEIPLTLKGAASQTANLLNFQNSAGTNRSWVDKDGVFTGNEAVGTAHSLIKGRIDNLYTYFQVLRSTSSYAGIIELGQGANGGVIQGESGTPAPITLNAGGDQNYESRSVKVRGKLSIQPATSGVAFGQSTDYIFDSNRTFFTVESSGSITNWFANRFGVVTLQGQSTWTTTNAATLRIDGAPIQGSNQTISNLYALWVGAGMSKFDGKICLSQNAPASSSASGMQGEIAWDSGFIYICTAANTWKRAALSTF